MATMLIFFLISAVLVIGAVSILSSAKEEELNPKNNQSKGIALEPKLSEKDIAAFSRKHKLVKSPAALIVLIVIITCTVIALPFIGNILFKGKSIFPRRNRMMDEGMTREQYEEICVNKLKPAFEAQIMNMLGQAFMGSDEDPSAAMEESFNAIAREYNLPSFEALLYLCSEADTRLNPDPEDRIFKQEAQPTGQ